MKKLPQKDALKDIIKGMMEMQLDSVKGFRKGEEVIEIEKEDSDEDEDEDILELGE